MNPPAGKSPLRFAPWTAAAALAVAALWVTRQNVSLQQANSAARTESQMAEVAAHLAQNRLTERTLVAEGMINSLARELRRSRELTRLKVTVLAPAAGQAPEARVIIVWDPEQQAGLLTADGLPAIADTRDYQLWITDPARPDPVSGGVLPVSPDGKATLAFKPGQPVTQAAAFAISLEKKGGGPKAEGTILLLGK